MRAFLRVGVLGLISSSTPSISSSPMFQCHLLSSIPLESNLISWKEPQSDYSGTNLNAVDDITILEGVESPKEVNNQMQKDVFS